MSIGSIGAGTVPAATTKLAGDTGAGTGAAQRATVADHVAAADAQEPIRSVSATLGTLVDTYL